MGSSSGSLPRKQHGALGSPEARIIATVVAVRIREKVRLPPGKTPGPEKFKRRKRPLIDFSAPVRLLAVLSFPGARPTATDSAPPSPDSADGKLDRQPFRHVRQTCGLARSVLELGTWKHLNTGPFAPIYGKDFVPAGRARIFDRRPVLADGNGLRNDERPPSEPASTERDADPMLLAPRDMAGAIAGLGIAVASSAG